MKIKTPQKRIFDSIHGFIFFNDLESQLIDSFPFQRLHYIRQLGSAYLVYPGAVHSRFEHSFGVMEIASQIFDRLVANSSMAEEMPDAYYYRQILRLAALCHDFGHLPFSHAAEHLLLKEGGHEGWTLKIIQSYHLEPIWEQLKQKFPEKDPQVDVIKLSIGKKKCEELNFFHPFTMWDTVLSKIITCDFFGADRIDYLLRDAKYTGLSYGVFDYHQLIEMLLILPALDKKEGEWELGVEQNGIESCEALLLARHFMHRRIYQYASVQAFSFHLARFMQTLYGNSDFQEDVDHYLFFTDNEVLASLNIAAKDPTHRAHNDALALFLRKKRFRAYEATQEMTDDFLKEFKKQHSIADSEIYWHLTGRKKGKLGMDFPVLKRNGDITPATDLSDLSIPTDPMGWVYIAPWHQGL